MPERRFSPITDKLGNFVPMKTFLVAALIPVAAFATKSMAQNPALAQKRYEEAVKMLQSGDREKSISLFVKVLEADSLHKNTLYNLCILLQENEDAKSALRYADILVRRYPDFPKVLSLRGKIKLTLNDMNGAFDDFNKQLLILPGYEAYSGLGTIALKNKDYPGAESFFSKAIDLFPESAGAHNDRGVTRMLLNNYNESLADFRQAMLLAPDEGFIVQNFGLAYREADQLIPAKSMFVQATKKDGTLISSLNLLGLLEIQQGRTDEALTYFMKAIENEPDDILSLVNSGAAYLMAGDMIKAKKYTDLALSLMPDKAEALFNRGVLHYLEGLEEEACQYWSRASEKGYPRSRRFFTIYCLEN